MVSFGDAEMTEIASCLETEDGSVRSLACRIMSRTKEAGLPFLRAALHHDSAEVRGDAAGFLLDTHPESAIERARCIAELVGNDRNSYLSNHKSLHVEVLPQLKLRAVDPKTDQSERDCATYLLGTFATKADQPFLERLLNSSASASVRGSLVHTISRLFPQGHPPQSIQDLANDPDLGPLIASYHYLEEPRPRDEERLPPPPGGSWEKSFSDWSVAATFAKFVDPDRPKDRANEAMILVKTGERGIGLLKHALTWSDEAVRGTAAMALLDVAQCSPESQKLYVGHLVEGLGDSEGWICQFLREHPELRDSAIPALRGRVLNSKLPSSVRTFAALHLAECAKLDDLAFFESLLVPSLPPNVRAAAIHAIYRVIQAEQNSEAVKNLESDSDLGPVIKLYGYLDLNR